MNQWTIIGFASGFFLAFGVVFFFGFWLGRRSIAGKDQYQLSEPLDSDFILSAKSKQGSSMESLPTTTKRSLPSATNELTTDTQLLHKRLGQMELSNVNIQLTEEFKHALELMTNSQKCIFVTGEAGTGKSTLLKYFVANTSKKLVVLSPTGVAAINVGGQTIHSFFKFPPRAISPSDIIRQGGEIYQALDAIIIDEISMVRADLMDAIDKALRLNRGCLDKSFGGAQIIMFGDLFQLPPVVTKSEEGQFFSQYYRSPYFFDAKVFDEVDIQLVKLKTIFRQNDPEFVEVLNRVRVNKVDDKVLDVLNQRVDPHFESSSNNEYITLTTTNRRADTKNLHELERIPNSSRIYEGTIEGKFDEIYYPTDLRLQLKVGAQVMMLTNDVGKRWANGTISIVEEMNDNSIKVRIPKPSGQPPQICEVGRHEWEVPEYRIDHANGILTSSPIGTFKQFPLRLAWAITVHKSQGKTLDRAVVDLAGGAFAHGQTYVALSRCTSLDGLVLKRGVEHSDIIVDQRVFGFFDRLQNRDS